MISVTEPRADQLITSQELIFDSTKKHHRCTHFVPTGAGELPICLVAALALCEVVFAVFPLVGLSEDQRKKIKELDRFGDFTPHQMSKSELKHFQNKLDTMTNWPITRMPIVVVVTESSLASPLCLGLTTSFSHGIGLFSVGLSCSVLLPSLSLGPFPVVMPLATNVWETLRDHHWIKFTKSFRSVPCVIASVRPLVVAIFKGTTPTPRC